MHVDAADLRTTEGKAHLFLAIDRVTKLVCRAHGLTHTPTKPYHPWSNG